MICLRGHDFLKIETTNTKLKRTGGDVKWDAERSAAKVSVKVIYQ